MSEALAQGVLIPSTTRRDLAFDFAGQNLYISNNTGIVQTFSLSTLTFGTSYNLGGSLNGMDIARNDSFLLVAQNATSGNQGTFHKVALPAGTVTNINYTRVSSETGAWDVAIASNGLALVTTQESGSGGLFPLRQIDLATNAITTRPEGTMVLQNTHIHRSADGTRLFFMGSNSSGGPIFTYSAASNTFGPSVPTGTFLSDASGAVNRDGSLVALRTFNNPASLNTASSFNYVRSFSGIDAGVAFSATLDTFYGVNTTTDQIIAYSTQTFTELFRLNIGEDMTSFSTEPFGEGTLVASADGNWLALETPAGIRLFQVGASAPSPTPTPTPINTPTATPGPGVPIVLPSTTRRDVVFDFGSQNIYISNSTGIVQTFSLSTLTFGTSYDAGGSLNGLDIARDNSFVLVAQEGSGATQGAFHKVNLASGSVTNINYTRSFGEVGAWDVGIGVNGLALVTTEYGGTGSVPLRQINLATNAITVRSDVPGFGDVRQETHVHRSTDGTRLFLMQSITSVGPMFTYSTATDTFGPSVDSGFPLSNASGAVNRDGGLVGLRHFSPASLHTAPNLTFVHSFNGIDGGVAFDATNDVFYGVNSATDQIIAYSTQTFAELFRVNIGENMPSGSTPFGTGPLVASASSHWLALQTPTGIRLFHILGSIPTPTPVVPTPTPTPSATPPATPTPSPTVTPPATPTPTATVTPMPSPSATPTPSPGQLGNIATRLRVETGDNVLIGGFIITGTQPKRVIVRAIGPALTPLGVPGALENPILELYDSSQLVTSNDNWVDAPNQQEIIDSTLAPTNNLESAILVTLPANNSGYTAVVRGVNQSAGVGLVEAYDLDRTVNSRLANISTRGLVQIGDDVMIGGFIVIGSTPKRVVVRAIGPSLTTIPNRLANPTLTLHDGNGALLQSNDDWMDAPNRQEIIDTTLAPTNDLESAILMTLPANSSGYTAIVRGLNSTTGVALVEVYLLQ